MKITIAERLHPFSHRSSTSCVLPKSHWKVDVFPTLLRFSSLSHHLPPIECVLHVTGPFAEFTVELDLEKGRILVFGQSPKGYLRYVITKTQEGIALLFEKIPGKILSTSLQEGIREKQVLLIDLPKEKSEQFLPFERLSLGMHKSQDMELIARRKDLREIFPLWFRLSQLLPNHIEIIAPIGTFRLLLRASELVAQQEKLHVVGAFAELFQTAFTGILSPRLLDEEYQGILPIGEKIPCSISSLPLLIEGGRLIRSLFFQEKDTGLHFLPCLPNDFTSGRFTGILTQEGEELCFEWAKHRMQKLIIRTKSSRSVMLIFPKMIHSFRLRTSLRESGTKKTVQGGQVILNFPENKTLFLDRFEK